MSANFAVLGLAMIAAGPLTDAVGARWVWGGAAALAGLASALGFVMTRGLEPQHARGEAVPLAPEPDPIATPIQPTV
jgi:hypothetical protein